MKNIIYTLILSLLIITSCNKSEDEVQRTNLTPTNQSISRIAPSTDSLKLILFSTFNENIKEISDIHYMDFKSGVGAMITYKTDNNKYVKCFYAKGVSFAVAEILMNRSLIQYTVQKKADYDRKIILNI